MIEPAPSVAELATPGAEEITEDASEVCGLQNIAP
jgi:hypothetical protein